MSTEVSALLAAELPGLRLNTLRQYPGPGAVAAVAAEAQACFLDIATTPQAAEETMACLAADFPGLPIVILLRSGDADALLRSSDADLILQFLRRGAAEFLIQPFTREQVERVLRKIPALREGASTYAGARGKVFVVLPGKGASGATTIACNLAHALRGAKSAKVLLADLDGLTGTVSFVLKLKSAYSFIDAVGQSSELDPDLWKALVTPAHGMDVLLSPENPVDCYAQALDPSSLVMAARQTYDMVVLDGGGIYGEWNASLIQLADEVVLVTTNELPALHATRRALAALDRSGVARSRLRIVLNRHQTKVGLPEDGVSTELQTSVYRILPNDTEAVRKALMEGKPVPHATNFGRSVAGLARALAGVEQRADKPSPLSSLFKLFR